MHYQQFRAVRDAIVRTGNPLRLDCMNPAKALATLASTCTGNGDAVDARAAWLGLFAPHAATDRVFLTTGVRAALGPICADLAAAGCELWLPEDVYPEYGTAAVAAGLRCHTFVTLPDLDLSPLERAGPAAALLLPQPLAPLGRSLSGDETTHIRAWLGEAPRRRLILDTVYHFDNRPDPVASELWRTGQTYVVHSIAKGWLLPDTLGVILTPPCDPGALALAGLPKPTPVACARAAAAMRSRPTMPREVAETIRRQWDALLPHVREAIPTWNPPATGYFSVVPVRFKELLGRHGMLAIPATVFGSRRDDLSVISCLYYPA